MAEPDFSMHYTESGSPHLPGCLCGTCRYIDWIEASEAFCFPLDYHVRSIDPASGLVNVSSYLARQQRRPPAITGVDAWQEEGSMLRNQTTEGHLFPPPNYRMYCGNQFALALRTAANFHGVPAVSLKRFLSSVLGCCKFDFETEATRRKLEEQFQQRKLVSCSLQISMPQVGQSTSQYQRWVDEEHRENCVGVDQILTKKRFLDRDKTCFISQAQNYYREARCIIHAYLRGERCVPREVGFVPDGHLALRGRKESGIWPFSVMQKSLRER